MHDEQAGFPLPRYLTTASDTHPAPGPATPRWVINWKLWGDLTDTGWGASHSGKEDKLTPSSH